MKIASIGGGPAGLYFAILMKKAFPETEITIYERNRADDTFGWGVVFSDETLGNFEDEDPESYRAIRENFIYWSDIETYYDGECVTSTGHGFCGMSRKRLLELLHERCRALGVELKFETEVAHPDDVSDADLILAADGVNSMVRDLYVDHFRPTLDWRKCKFCWLGTSKPLEAFTFIFKENEHGLFSVHAYPFQDGLSTWIVECREETWKKAGLDEATEEETVAYCEKLFADDLGGYPLLTNRSVWRTFPTVSNETWHHGNVVLMGDSAHTAHFSIGSGTKLAMEDAIALVDAFKEKGTEDVESVLETYEESRYVDVLKIQKAAQTSLEWFEHVARYTDQPALQFTFNLMTRSKRITWDNLALRDPALVARMAEWYREKVGAPRAEDGSTPEPVFTPFRIGDMTLVNRVVVSPMCQYSAVDGTPGDWHLVHLGSRAIGGAGLVITEMTNVTADGRITPGCTGMYTDEHAAAWRKIVDFVHAHSVAKIGLQLAHAGRKGSVHHPWEGGADVPLAAEEAWPVLGPSAVPFDDGWATPKAMDRGDMDRITSAFVDAARRAELAGFDLVELHMAHGYLLSSFISPLSNQRTDEYGGSFEGRMRYPLEVLDAVRAVWTKPLSVRITASDWVEEGGIDAAEAVEIARQLREHGCDLVDVSSGGNSLESKPIYGRMYQLPFAEKIRYEVDIPVMTVGAVTGADHANTILAAGRADLCAMARPHLYDPYLTLHEAERYGFEDQVWPGQYLPGRTPPRPTV